MRGLLRILSFIVLLALPLSSAFAASAYVHELRGTLSAQYGSAAPRPLKIGDTLDPGVTLRTGANSTAVVKFEDGQLVVLQPNTRFVVRAYDFNRKQIRKSNVFFQLLQGGLRFVTGVIGATNHNAFKLAVGTATIGVRGTDGWASIVQGIVTAAVNSGAVTLTTAQGTALLPVGDFTVARPNAAPARPVPVAQAGTLVQQTPPAIRAAVQQAVTQSVAEAKQAQSVAIPINTPVVVAASAQAAAAAATARAAAALAAAAPSNEAAQAAAAKAAALAQAALNTAVQAATQVLNNAISNGAVLPAAPAPVTPSPTPAPAPTPTLTPQQVEDQVKAINQAVEQQTSQLQQTQQNLNLPVTPTTAITNATSTTVNTQTVVTSPPPTVATTSTTQATTTSTTAAPTTTTAGSTTTTAATTTTTAPATSTTAPTTTTTAATTTTTTQATNGSPTSP